MSNALQGLKVVSLGASVSAPLCARFLADLGADVIKVEKPGTGDFARGWDEVLPGVSSAHLWCNPNKRSITLNLKSPKGCEALGRLVERADVFLENFSPGVVGKLGLDYAWAKGVNSRLIYCHISGYGQDGPYRDMKALDMLIQGEAGVIHLTGPPETPAKVALSIAELPKLLKKNSQFLFVLVVNQQRVLHERCFRGFQLSEEVVQIFFARSLPRHPQPEYANGLLPGGLYLF